MNATWAKAFGWLQFLATSVPQVIASGGVPHGATGWFGILGSLLMAGGIHAAASTDGQK